MTNTDRSYDWDACVTLSGDFKVFADPTRLTLLLLLESAGSGRSVTALAEDVASSVAKTSHHLRAALTAGMVEKTEWRWYRLTEKGERWVRMARDASELK